MITHWLLLLINICTLFMTRRHATHPDRKCCRQLCNCLTDYRHIIVGPVWGKPGLISHLLMCFSLVLHNVVSFPLFFLNQMLLHLHFFIFISVISSFELHSWMSSLWVSVLESQKKLMWTSLLLRLTSFSSVIISSITGTSQWHCSHDTVLVPFGSFSLV